MSNKRQPDSNESVADGGRTFAVRIVGIVLLGMYWIARTLQLLTAIVHVFPKPLDSRMRRWTRAQWPKPIATSRSLARGA